MIDSGSSRNPSGTFRTSPPGIDEFRNHCRRVLRIFRFEQTVRSEFDHIRPFRMRKNIELLLSNCIKDHVSDLPRRHTRFYGSLECSQTDLHFRCHHNRLVLQFRGPMTFRVRNICMHKPWAQNRYFDERVSFLQRQVQAFRKGYHLNSFMASVLLWIGSLLPCRSPTSAGVLLRIVIQVDVSLPSLKANRPDEKNQAGYKYGRSNSHHRSFSLLDLRE